ncbi:MAG: FimV/HubP family polar landmark protein [Burkholderiales bacterium]
MALLCAPLMVHAAGLGRLQVDSALGQPLRAEIEIVSLQPGEEDSLQARLATREAFRQAGIEMSPALVGMQFAIERRGGRPVIRLRTTHPVNEPFLDVLVELSWATGRLVREYTFLLDPAEYKGPPPVAAAPAPVAKPAPAAKPEPAPRAAPRPLVAEPGAPAGAKQHDVKKGDTLSAIARQNLPAGVTLNQMMMALYRANEAAFIQGNINLVRAGRILSVPDREAVLALGTAEATQQVQAHMADFAEYRRKLGQVVAAAPAAPVREREVAGRITPPKAEAPAPAETKDQLKLSKADPTKPGSSPAAKAARDDDRVARERALKESQSRIGELEKNVADLQKLLEMKNQQLAELEKKAAAKPAAPAPAPAPAAKAPEPVKEAPKEAPKEAVKEAPKETAKEAPKEAPKEAAKEAPKETAKKAAKAVPAKAAPVPETSLVDEILAFLTDPVSGGGLAVVVLMLFGYGFWAWKRKKKSQASKFQDSVLGAASGAGASSVFSTAGTAVAAATPPPAAAAAAEVSETSVSSVSVGAAESDEVDPIAEADVYMAYGRDAQAEEILKEALGKDPNRLAVHAKLLEIYANRKDKKNFEQTALKVKSLTNSAGPEWDKAMALGHSIDPENGLYGSGGAAAEAAPAAAPAAAAPTLDFDIGGSTGETQAVAPAAAPALDFDIGAQTAAIPKSDFAAGGTLKLDTAESKPVSAGLDFDLGGATDADDGEKTMLMPPRKPAAAAAPEKKADPDATVAMDFDLNLDLGTPKTEAPTPAAEAPIDLGGLSLDLGVPAAGGAAGGADPKWQEVATKLDLAKAYQDMGDKDGARELLNEVLKEGDAAQQGQAQQMLSSLG